MMISSKMAPKPYIETLISKISKHWSCKSSYYNLSYWYVDIENINPLSLKYHIEPALVLTLLEGEVLTRVAPVLKPETW